jgi:hypothetical protein
MISPEKCGVYKWRNSGDKLRDQTIPTAPRHGVDRPVAEGIHNTRKNGLLDVIQNRIGLGIARPNFASVVPFVYEDFSCVAGWTVDGVQYSLRLNSRLWDNKIK